MSTPRTYLAWVCVVLLAASGVVSLILFNVEREAFSAETYKQAFEKQGLYIRMPAILAEALYTSVQDGSSDPYLKVLTVADWEASIASLLPPEDLKVLSDDALDSMFAYLNNKTNFVNISLVPIKIRLAGPQGMEVVRLIINAQPDCTLEQLMQMGLGFFSGDISLCKPPEEMMGLISPILESQMQALTNAIPDTVTLILAENNTGQTDPRIRMNRVRIIMKLTVLLPMLLLGVLTLLAVRSQLDWLHWWGYPFLFTGLLGVFAASVSSPILRLVIQGVMQRQAGDLLPPILIPVMGETIGTVAGLILLPVVFQGAILGTIGFIMVITALLARPR